MSDRFDNSNSNASLKSGHAPAISGTELQQNGLTREDVIARQAHAVDQRFRLTGKPQPDSTQKWSITEVDSKVIQGSHGVGDHRIVAKPAVLPQNPGPREGMRQESLNSKLPANQPGHGNKLAR